MGGVVISPNIKKEKVFIDPQGNEVLPYTKQIIKKAEPDYVPTKEEIEAKINAPPEPVPVPLEIKKLNPLAEAIKKQVQEQVQKTLKEIDIAAMVKQAIEEAFK